MVAWTASDIRPVGPIVQHEVVVAVARRMPESTAPSPVSWIADAGATKPSTIDGGLERACAREQREQDGHGFGSRDRGSRSRVQDAGLPLVGRIAKGRLGRPRSLTVGWVADVRNRRTEIASTRDPVASLAPPKLIEHLDVDGYRAALATWDMRAVPLQRGRFRLRWVLREMPDMSLVRYTTATSIREEYVKEAGSTAFVLILPGDHERFRVSGAELAPMTLTMLHPGAPYEVISPAGGEALEVYVPDEMLASLGLERWLDPRDINVRPSPAAAQRLRIRLEPLLRLGREARVDEAVERAAILEELAATLDSVDRSVAPAPTIRLHQVYRRAVAAIEDEPDPMLTVVELAVRLGVTTRTLRYAFRYAIGLSPYQFMLRRRLTLLRSALQDPSRSERTVLDLLLAHGISHQGEFAGQYRRLFGETPSETRARALRSPRRLVRPATWPPLRGDGFPATGRDGADFA